MIHYAVFYYDAESYVAAGENKIYMAVYKKYTLRVYHRWGETRWPSWAKFMHGDVTSYEEGKVKDVDELKEKFGRFISSQNEEVGEQMTERTADSRWTDNPFQPPNASPELLEWYEKRDEAIRIWRETGDETMAIEIGLFPTPEEEAEVEREMAMEEGFKVGVRECGNRLMAVAGAGESKGIHFASFQYDEENYLAFGESNHYLAVFVEGEPRRYFRHGETCWPSWAKFMHGEVEDYEEGWVSSVRVLERRYGAIVCPNREEILDDGAQSSRSCDNPFQPPPASPELLEWFRKRNEAVRIWRETGDDSMAIEIGLFPLRVKQREDGGEVLTKRMYEYGKWHLEVIRTSPDSVTVNLVCENHEHEDFIIGKVDGHTGWGVGRKDSGSGFDGSFTEAVEHCGDQLILECDNIESIAEVEEFFGGEQRGCVVDP